MKTLGRRSTESSLPQRLVFWVLTSGACGPRESVRLADAGAGRQFAITSKPIGPQEWGVGREVCSTNHDRQGVVPLKHQSQGCLTETRFDPVQSPSKRMICRAPGPSRGGTDRNVTIPQTQSSTRTRLFTQSDLGRELRSARLTRTSGHRDNSRPTARVNANDLACLTEAVQAWEPARVAAPRDSGVGSRRGVSVHGQRAENSLVRVRIRTLPFTRAGVPVIGSSKSFLARTSSVG